MLRIPPRSPVQPAAGRPFSQRPEPAAAKLLGQHGGLGLAAYLLGVGVGADQGVQVAQAPLGVGVDGLAVTVRQEEGGRAGGGVLEAAELCPARRGGREVGLAEAEELVVQLRYEEALWCVPQLAMCAWRGGGCHNGATCNAVRLLQKLVELLHVKRLLGGG